MKFRKYIAVAFGVIAILLVSGWFLRNTIIQRISNPLLAEYDVTVTDVSLDALATNDASISYLEVEHVNGTIFAIEHLTLPLGASANGFKSYSAEKITIKLPSNEKTEVPDLAGLLDQLLALPSQLPGTEVSVAELHASPYPVLHDLRWRSTGNNQQLTALVESTRLTTKIARTDDYKHVLDISFVDASGATERQTVTVDIQQSDSAIGLKGTTTLDLPLWMPLLKAFGLNTLDIQSGSATLRFDTEFLYDTSGLPAAYAEFAPTTPIQLSYAIGPDAITSITVESAGHFEISASTPDFAWAFSQSRAQLLVSYDRWREIPVSLTNFSCQHLLTCQGDIAITMENAKLPFAEVERLEFAATQEVIAHDGNIEVHIGPDATIELIGISGPDTDLARFGALLTSGAILEIEDSGWHVTARSADVTIDGYSVTDDVTFSAPMFLDDVSLGEVDEQLTMKIGVYASSSQVYWSGQSVQLPGFKGGVARQGAEIDVFLETDGLYEEASVDASHNLDHETGRLAMTNAGVSFGRSDLANRVSPSPNGWNISAGTLAFDLQADWHKPDNDEWQVTGQSSVRMANLAGAWNGTAFTGLSTDLQTQFDTTTGIAVQPSIIEVALIEMGLPIEDLAANYTLHPSRLSVDVENLRMTTFGGVITADPFSFSTGGERNNLLIRANSIDLAEILSFKEFEAIEISGSIGAELPVTIEGNSVTIVGGTLSGEPPGGVIRYLPGIGGDETDASIIGLATRALSNFEYDTLNAEVDYSASGDLNLQMHLTGRNPDLEDSRPVVLNLGVENNIPQMLRSLKAARAVEEILERRLEQ